MTYRKGELSSKGIDLGWPHQVALPEYATRGERYITVRLFSEDLSLCPRGHSFVGKDGYYNVYCFAQREHAERFRARFGGEIIAPEDRPKWPGKR